MNGSCSITTRGEGPKRRWIVRYRLGGRGFDPIHAGSYKTKREAEARKRWIDGELAAGRTPNRRALEHQASSVTVYALCKAWTEGRIDVSDNTREGYRYPLERIAAGLKGVKAAEVDGAQIAAFVVALHEQGVKGPSIVRVLAVLRGALDDFGRDPNPARSRVVRVPKERKVEANPPPFGHWQLILDGVTERFRLPMRVLEGTGLRVGELEELRWGDVDSSNNRLFVRGGKTPSARRWVPIPAPLIDDFWNNGIDPAPEDKVFPGFQGGSLRYAMRRTCKRAGIPLYSPHDLRHRRISLWVRQGTDPAVVAAWVGHTKKSLTLDHYSHLLLNEPPHG